MVRLRGLLSLGAAFVAVTALMGTQESRAASYFLTVTIYDQSTSTTTFTGTLGENAAGNVYQAPAGSVNPEQITPNAGSTLSNTASAGVTLTGLGTSTSYGAANATLSLSGTAQVTGSSTDTYVVTINATYSGYTVPPGSTGELTQTSSDTFTHTAGGSQSITTTYTSGALTYTAGPDSFNIPTGATPPPAGTGPTGVGLNPYSPNYNLSETITLTIKGNPLASAEYSNAKVTFGSQAVVTAVPEPASLVMMLTGMPLPLVVLGLLRRRRAND